MVVVSVQIYMLDVLDVFLLLFLALPLFSGYLLSEMEVNCHVCMYVLFSQGVATCTLMIP